MCYKLVLCEVIDDSRTTEEIFSIPTLLDSAQYALRELSFIYVFCCPPKNMQTSYVYLVEPNLHYKYAMTPMTEL